MLGPDVFPQPSRVLSGLSSVERGPAHLFQSEARSPIEIRVIKSVYSRSYYSCQQISFKISTVCC